MGATREAQAGSQVVRFELEKARGCREQTLGALVGVTLPTAGTGSCLPGTGDGGGSGEEAGTERCRPAAPGFEQDHTEVGLTHKKLYMFHVYNSMSLEMGVHP